MPDDKKDDDVISDSTDSDSASETKEQPEDNVDTDDDTQDDHTEPENRAERRIKNLIGKLKAKDEKLKQLEDQLKELDEVDIPDEGRYLTPKDLEKHLDKLLGKKEKQKMFSEQLSKFKQENSIGNKGWEKIKGENIEKSAKTLVVNGMFTTYYDALNHLYNLKSSTQQEQATRKEEAISGMGTGGNAKKVTNVHLTEEEKQIKQKNPDWDDERVKKAAQAAKQFFSS